MTDDPRPPDLPTRTEGEGETLDMPEGMRPFTPGQILGERYQILEMLGRGGMGEVWHAFDLKLRVEVALKALRQNVFKNERRLGMLRQEVRAAREVVSPNVCRIFDLIEVEGRELVSMEYVDGATLLAVLYERGPLELKEAQDIASQFLAGLESIHRAGLIHRDIKPENIMLTRAGRVVVMDFGLARQETEGGGTVSGTPAYMAPEQAAGETLDARADVYAAGVVLAEMVCPDGIKNIQSRQSVWEGVRSEPAELPDTPWAQVIQKAVKKDREGRFNSAHTLTRALEDVTLRVEGADDLHPYPGLASFTESDAEYFFGREAEVEQMWRKLEGPPRMLAIIGPSGAGKSSFIAAGLAANAPTTWGILRSTPGNSAISSLAAVVAREMAGDPDAVELLPRFGDADVAVELISRWAGRNSHSLLVIDQFEELFTQNTSDEQRKFSDLLRRFVIEGDIHVLLSMRDDFAVSCNAHESLRPIFHELTVLDPPAGPNLRRGLVQPALQCGYRFEDDELVDKMLTEVEGERGALPLLAFAAARLWDRRNKENGLLTREAYDDIGGVGGALAQHAEATIDRIGIERIPIVRELFRNLVTAEGTRAVREWNDLLSIFEAPQLESAEEVLRELIDARLLTSYEIHEDEQEPTRRVEIIHESLLANWPRLVRWQTQDQEGAQLRDELRQAARAWDEHDRHDDRLWTGTAFREYQLWRERYPGGLTDLEEAFAADMTSLAGRRRRRRRMIVTAVIAALIAGLAIVGSFWQRSVRETRRAEAEANRAEAGKLLALGQLVLESYPTAALAWATSSLELADTSEGRKLALRALQKAPPVRILPAQPEAGRAAASVTFSPNGQRLVTAENHALVWSQDNPEPMILEHQPPGGWLRLAFPKDDLLLTEGGSGDLRWWNIPGTEAGGDLRWWALPGGEMTRREPGGRGHLDAQRGDGYLSFSQVEEGINLDWWPVGEGAPRAVGSLKGAWALAVDAQGSQLAFSRGETVLVRSIEDWSKAPRVLGRHNRKVWNVVFHPSGRRVAAFDESLEIREWQTEADTAGPIRTFSSDVPIGASLNLAYDQTGRWLATYGGGEGLLMAVVWDLTAPQGCPPLVLRGEKGYANPGSLAFHPDGNWLVAAPYYSVGFWPMTHPYPWVLPHHGRVYDVAFTPDSEWLVTATAEFVDPESSDHSARVRAWPLRGQNDGKDRVLLRLPMVALYGAHLALDPSGKNVAVSADGDVFIAPVEGGPVRRLASSSGPIAGNSFIAFSPDGGNLASVPWFDPAGSMPVRVWDLETGNEKVVGSVPGATSFLGFAGEHQLLWAGADARTEDEAGGGERLFDLELGTVEVLSEGGSEQFRAISPDGSFLVSTEMDGSMSDYTSRLVRRDLATGESTVLETHGNNTYAVDLDPTGTWVATGGFSDGTVRVGSVSGDEPDIFYGHTGEITAVAVSPDGRWIASSSDDSTVRLTPMPDLSKPPLHTLPHDELIAKLKTLTNLRVVRDEDSPTGWKTEIGPFPGWAEVPEW